MSGINCGNCGCADKSQCGKGNSYVADLVESLETETSYVETSVVMEVSAAENGGTCKCGPSCPCVDCKCGH